MSFSHLFPFSFSFLLLYTEMSDGRKQLKLTPKITTITATNAKDWCQWSENVTLILILKKLLGSR